MIYSKNESYVCEISNLYITLYHRHVRLGKIIVYVGFGTTCAFGHPLRVLDRVPQRKGGHRTLFLPQYASLLTTPLFITALQT